MTPRQRKVRFGRLRQLDVLKLERLAELARQAAGEVERAGEVLDLTRRQFEQALQDAGARPDLVEQLRPWESRSQQELATLEQRLLEAVQARESARQAVEQQQLRVRAWDKLLEQIGAEAAANELAVETRFADEAYLQKQLRQRA